jgi:hypothetical protein
MIIGNLQDLMEEIIPIVDNFPKVHQDLMLRKIFKESFSFIKKTGFKEPYLVTDDYIKQNRLLWNRLSNIYKGKKNKNIYNIVNEYAIKNNDMLIKNKDNDKNMATNYSVEEYRNDFIYLFTNTDMETSLKDYLEHLAINDIQIKLDKMSFTQILNLADNYHKKLAKSNNKNTLLGEIKKIVKCTNPSYQWFLLEDVNSKKYEGDLMGHCVGGGGYRNNHIYSLRGLNQHPHVTIDYSPARKAILQCKGKANTIPANYINELEDFLNFYKVDSLSYDISSLFFIIKDKNGIKSYCSINKIKEKIETQEKVRIEYIADNNNDYYYYNNDSAKKIFLNCVFNNFNSLLFTNSSSKNHYLFKSNEFKNGITYIGREEYQISKQKKHIVLKGLIRKPSQTFIEFDKCLFLNLEPKGEVIADTITFKETNTNGIKSLICNELFIQKNNMEELEINGYINNIIIDNCVIGTLRIKSNQLNSIALNNVSIDELIINPHEKVTMSLPVTLDLIKSDIKKNSGDKKVFNKHKKEDMDILKKKY